MHQSVWLVIDEWIDLGGKKDEVGIHCGVRTIQQKDFISLFTDSSWITLFCSAALISLGVCVCVCVCARTASNQIDLDVIYIQNGGYSTEKLCSKVQLLSSKSTWVKVNIQLENLLE